MQEIKKPHVGFIGFGEASFEICRGLKSEGLTGIVAYDKYWDTPPRASLIKSRALEAGVILLASSAEVVTKSDVIFCAVNANAAVSIAREAAPFLGKGKIYVDINSASPRTKQDVAKIVESVGADFVDIAIMGAVPEQRHRVLMLACGSGVKKLIDLMSHYGMNIKDVGEMPGVSSAIKMCRSVFMKGYAALWIECLLAASAYGCENVVLDSICESIEGKDLHNYVLSFLVRTGIHAERRAAEMREVISTLKDANLASAISEASLYYLDRIKSLSLSEDWLQSPPRRIEEVIAAFKKGWS